MTFKDRMQRIEWAEKQAAMEPEAPAQGEAAEAAPSPEVEPGIHVHCSECGNNTLREEHNAIMCTICCHGPFCNYCWEVHVRQLHPLMAGAYSKARRGGRARTSILNSATVRAVKLCGLFLGLVAALAITYYLFLDRGKDQPNSSKLAALSSLDVVDVVDPAKETPADVSTKGTTETKPSRSTESSGPALEASVPVLTAPPVNDPSDAAPRPAAAGPFVLELTDVTSPVHRRSEASVRVHTVPGATCVIEVRYSSGPSKSKGLGSQVADASGNVIWTWRIGVNTTLGTWPVHVSCTAGGQQRNLRADITVVT